MKEITSDNLQSVLDSGNRISQRRQYRFESIEWGARAFIYILVASKSKMYMEYLQSKRSVDNLLISAKNAL